VRVDRAAHAVDAGAEELVEHVVLVGGNHQRVWIGRPIMRATWPAQTLPKLPEGTVKLTGLSLLAVAWK
jgi:hypothetical protein